MLALPDIIRRKRDGHELSDAEIRQFLKMTTDGSAQDCQIGAMLMAMFLKGLSKKEMISLTTSMVESGDILEWNDSWLLVDKHSTGGVGDKVSLPLAPALAACGCKVPMVSGRGLDFTGGTLDKLESIPGFKVSLNYDEMKNALETAGCFIAGPTGSLAPADKELYKIRDVTATVDSTPLIVGSIISKKVAEGTKFLVMDIKVGNAAFYKDVESAKVLGNSLIEVAEGLGVKCRAVLSKMDTPIGKSVGNALEVAETIKCLNGGGPSDLRELVTLLGGLLLELCGKAVNLEEGKKFILEALTNGAALRCFEQMLLSQGVSVENARELCRGNIQSVLPAAGNVEILKAAASGYIGSIDAMSVAKASWALGAGRSKAGDPIDYTVGVKLLHVEGEEISYGQPWCEIHHQVNKFDAKLRQQLEQSITITSQPPNSNSVSRIIQIL